MVIPHINVYLETTAVEDASLNGSVHRIKYFFNKRFFKLTEVVQQSTNDLKSFLNVFPADVYNTKTLIGLEGATLPTKSELIFAKKGKFDLYTITNLSFMDLAL